MSERRHLARLELARRAARNGGALALSLYERRDELEVESKGRQDRATEADRRVEQLITAAISDACPTAAILGEEGGLRCEQAEDDELWVVDPIDGTDCFVFGLPMWSVSIAWMRRGRVMAGVVFDPIHDELYSAARGEGAFLNGQPIRASDSADLGSGLVGIGHSLRVGPERKRCSRSSVSPDGADCFIVVARARCHLPGSRPGRLIGYFEPHMNAWDCLAGLLLVSEAGGWHNDFLDEDGLARGNRVLASGPCLAEEVRGLGGRLLKPPRRLSPVAPRLNRG